MLALVNANTYSGGTTIKNGELDTFALGALPSGHPVVLSSTAGDAATLFLNGYDQSISGLSFYASRTTSICSIDLGGAALTLTGDIQYLNNAVVPGYGYGAVIQGSGALDLDGGIRTITVAANDNPTDLLITTSITNGGLAITGIDSTYNGALATVALTGTNTYSLGTTVNNALLEIVSDSNLGNSAGSLTLHGAAVQAYGPITGSRPIVIGSGGGVIDSNGYNITWSGGMTGAGSLFKTGSGDLVVHPFTLGGTVTVSGGALAASAGSGTSKAGDLDAAAAQYDLADNRLVLSASSVGTVLPQLASGFNAKAWDGLGIVSSTAKNDVNQVTAIGYGTGADLYGLTGTTTSLWNGQTIDANSVLLQYTYYGDTDLDGNVDFDDIALTDRGHRRGLTGWLNGDFNYDGVMNDADYDLLNAAYAYLNPGSLARGDGGGSSGEYEPIRPPVDGFTEEFIAGRVERFGSGYADALAALLAEDEGGGEMSVIMTVPEPACGAVLVVGTAVAATRRRRRRSR